MEFPDDVQSDMLDALTVAAEGGKSDKAKPFKGVEGGVFEIALRYRGDAFRTMQSRSAPTYGWSMSSKRNQNRESKRRNGKSI